MPDELDQLEDSVREFRSSADFEFVDPKRLAALIDGLQGDLCKVLNRARERGERPALRRPAPRLPARDLGRPWLRRDRLPGGGGDLSSPRPARRQVGAGQRGGDGGQRAKILGREPAPLLPPRQARGRSGWF